MRAAVIAGAPRKEGIAALRYHGMLHGLPMLAKADISRSTPASRIDSDAPPQPGAEFVRLLANLVLHTHSELTHVY